MDLIHQDIFSCLNSQKEFFFSLVNLSMMHEIQTGTEKDHEIIIYCLR